jgi:L-fuculose-phosphate aldolase
MRFFRERRELLDTARRMSSAGLSHGTSGNLSTRVERGLLITATGMPYDEMATEDMVELSFDGHAPIGQRLPSSEWRLHRDIYQRRADVNAIVHTHSRFCTTLACLRRPIPAVHYMIGATGTSIIRCAPYATFGSEELSRATVETLGSDNACLMANHGMVAVGASLAAGLKIASEVELLAELYWRGLQIREPHVLDDSEIARVMEKFRSYGQRRRTAQRDPD